jgi:hypothetical protein
LRVVVCHWFAPELVDRHRWTVRPSSVATPLSSDPRSYDSTPGFRTAP